MEFGIETAAGAARAERFPNGFSALSSCYHNDDDGDTIDDDSFMRRRFFFLAVKLSCPLSVFESLSESSLDELELEDDDDEDELESEAKPVLSFKFTHSAIFAKAGSFSCDT